MSTSIAINRVLGFAKDDEERDKEKEDEIKEFEEQESAGDRDPYDDPDDID